MTYNGMPIAFAHLLTWLMNLPGQFSAWQGTDATYNHVVYQGTALQSWLIAVGSHGSIFWGIIH